MRMFRGVRAFDVRSCVHRGLLTVVLLFAGLIGAAHAQTSLFTNQTPAIPNVTDGVPYEIGMKFQVARAGQITAVRY